MRLVCAVVVVTLAALPSPSEAQRDDAPRIPQPISVVELGRYGDILGLSDGQRLAVEAAYDDYLDQLDPLRREMIEAAVAHPNWTRTGEDFTALLPAFVARARTADELFFASVDALLADAQHERLPRVRDVRTRTMLCNIDALGRFIGDSLPELRELLEELQPPPEALAALAPALTEYERRATIAVRDIFDATMRLCGSAQPDDHAKQTLIDGVRSLRSTNRKLVEDLAPTLPADVSRKWRVEFLARAYGHAAESARLHVIARANAALAMDLADGERASVQALLDSAVQFESQTMRRMLDLHDQDAIRPAPPQGAVDDPAIVEARSTVQTEAMARDRELTTSLNTLLGEVRAKALKPMFERYPHTMGGLRSGCGITVNVGRIYRPESQRGVPMSRSDPLIPAPLTAADGELIAAAMHLDSVQRAAVIERVQAAAAALDESLKPMRERLMLQTMWKRPGSEPAEDPMTRAQAGDATRVEMRGKVRQADVTLLEEIRAANNIAADDPAWRRIVRLRERAFITPDLAIRSPSYANCAGEIDLMRLILQLDPDDGTWAVLEPLTSAYETQLLGLFGQMLEDLGKYMVMDAAQRNGWRDESGYEATRKREESLHQQLQAVAALNQESVARFAAALPAEAAVAIINQFDRAAYPLAFDGRAAMTATFDRAIALPGLTGEQRERIGQARSDFQAAEAENRQAIISVCAAVKPDMPMVGRTISPERAAGEERFTLEYDLLNDERAQIDRRALRALRIILTAEQFASITPADVRR